ncbi:cell division protein FtsA [Oleiharenicola lentus]|uniref:cell division protein FtsA n=1 Tax=Oleiharenicola lentus TaxID=2508720 RepID=UPI003F672785
MISNSSRIIAAVEIGTGKIAVLIGEVARGRSLNIIGVGVAPSRGVLKGEVVDYKAACEATHHALEMAEKRAGIKIEEVWIAQTGGHLDGFYNEGSVNVKSADNTVTALDIASVCDLAKQKELPAGRSRIHEIRRPFRLDGRAVPDPEHLSGRRLEVGYWIVHGHEGKVSDNIHVVGGYHLEVREIVLASLASGSLLTTLEERTQGALVIDIGKGVTDYVLYRDGHVLTTGTLPVAGDHVTNDLSLGLRVTTAQAEVLKMRWSRATVQTRDKSEKVWLNGDASFGDRQLAKVAIETISAARMLELLEVVKQKLGHAFAPEHCGAGVVLTGGSSRMPGIEEAASRVFGVPARRGESPSWVKEELADPMFSSVLGVFQFGLRGAYEHAMPPRRKTGLLSNLTKLFST